MRSPVSSSVAVPTLLFRLMSDFSHLPHTDRLLIAYFGSCLIVFVLGRVVRHFLFRMDGASQSVFAVGAFFQQRDVGCSASQARSG